MACGVFAFVFLLLFLCLPFVFSPCPAFCPFALSFVLSLLLLSFACPLALSLLSCFVFSFGVAGVAFSLSDVQTKRKGAIPCVLSCPVVGCCYMLSTSRSVASFDFENIHPAPQVRCALNLPPRVLRVSLIALVSPTTAIAFSE